MNFFSSGAFFIERWLGLDTGGDVVRSVVRHAGQALVVTGNYAISVDSADDVHGALQAVPGWTPREFGAALQALATSLFAGCLLVAAAALLALLLKWRRRGAGIAG